MLLQNPNPINIEGVEYPYLACSLSVSPNIQSNYVGTSVSVRMVPAASIDGSMYLAHGADYEKVIAFSDITTEGSNLHQAWAEALKAVLQSLINEQGI